MSRRLARVLLPLISILAISLPVTAAPAVAQEPGESFRDCPDCPEMVVVPAGRFVMGSDQGHARQGPPVEVTIDRPFAIGRTEVTFDLWDACADAGVCLEDPSDHDWGRGRRPVVNVPFEQVQAYAGWLTERTGRHYRLPTEAEWEYAARAGSDTRFPWGDDVGKGLVNCRKCGAEPYGGSRSAPVATYPANPFGLHDMHGNVWEWVEDCWHPTHAGRPADASARLDGACTHRVNKSGAWYYIPVLSGSASRVRTDPRLHSYTIGFRLAAEVEPAD